MKTYSLKIIAATMALFMVAGCTSNQILSTLEASVAATEVLVGALSFAGKIPPELAGQIQDAIGELPGAFQQTSAELATTDSSGLKAAKISSYYAGTIAALKVLPPAAQFYTSAVLSAINVFLSNYAPTTTLSAGRTSPALDTKPIKLNQRAAMLSVKLNALNRR